jgi:hypothetical protein
MGGEVAQLEERWLNWRRGGSMEERWLNGSACVNTYRFAARDSFRNISGRRPHRDLVFRPVARESAVLGAVFPACSCLAPSAQAEAFLALVYCVHLC